MVGVIMTDIKKGNEKAKRDAEAERAFRYASDTSLFYRVLQREDSLV